MGLDLQITQMSDFRTDKKGRETWTTTVLCNLRNTYQFLDNLNWSMTNGIENNAYYSVQGSKLWECANDIEDEAEKERVYNALTKADIINDEEEFYDIGANW